ARQSRTVVEHRFAVVDADSGKERAHRARSPLRARLWRLDAVRALAQARGRDANLLQQHLGVTVVGMLQHVHQQLRQLLLWRLLRFAVLRRRDLLRRWMVARSVPPSSLARPRLVLGEQWLAPQ